MKSAIVAAMVCASGFAQAITIDSERYFAYLPDPRNSITILVSRQDCSVKTMAGRGYKAAGYVFHDGSASGHTVASCWVRPKDPIDPLYGAMIRVCRINPRAPQDDTLVMCEYVSESLFRGTKALPVAEKKPKF